MKTLKSINNAEIAKRASKLYGQNSLDCLNGSIRNFVTALKQGRIFAVNYYRNNAGDRAKVSIITVSKDKYNNGRYCCLNINAFLYIIGFKATGCTSIIVCGGNINPLTLILNTCIRKLYNLGAISKKESETLLQLQINEFSL